jgi:hypothetical protein
MKYAALAYSSSKHTSNLKRKLGDSSLLIVAGLRNNYLPTFRNVVVPLVSWPCYLSREAAPEVGGQRTCRSCGTLRWRRPVEEAVSLLGLIYPEDEGTALIRNVVICLSVNTESRPRRLESSATPLREPQILRKVKLPRVFFEVYTR